MYMYIQYIFAVFPHIEKVSEILLFSYHNISILSHNLSIWFEISVW